MRSIVIYYSFSGNTKLIAEHISKELDADIEELVTEKPLNASGAGYVMWGIRQLISQSRPALMPLKHDLGEYDLIVIGTPVWSYTFTPPVRTLLEENDFSGKKTAVFCCHGGDYGKTLENMKKALSKSNVLGTADFLDPLKNNSDNNCRKAEEWARKLKQWK